MINLVQRKITAPLVSSGVNYVVDQSLQGYHKKQQEVLASYTQAIAAKTYQSELTVDIIDKPADISQKAGSLSSDELARIKALQRSPLAAESCDQFISQLSEELKQPIYFFKDGKLVKSYGLSQTGKAISIAYDSQSGQYLNLSAKESSNSSSIYQALAKAQDVYGASELVKMHQGLMDTGEVVDRTAGRESTVNIHPANALQPIDYSLLLQAQAQQELLTYSNIMAVAGLAQTKEAELLPGTIDYLNCFFKARTQPVEQRQLENKIDHPTAEDMGMFQATSIGGGQKEMGDASHSKQLNSRDKKTEKINALMRAPLPDILDINPAIEASRAKYCMVVIGDLSLTQESGEVRLQKGLNIGHFYFSLGKITEQGCVKDISVIYGMNPAITNRPIAKGIINDEFGRYSKLIEYEDDIKIKIHAEKVIPLTDQNLADLDKFIKESITNPGRYVGHFNDCIEFTHQALKVIGLGGLRVNDIIQAQDINGFSLAKISAALRSYDNMGVDGLSAEEVADRYNIPVERVIENYTVFDTSGYQAAPRFTIMPYQRYLQQKNNKGQ